MAALLVLALVLEHGRRRVSTPVYACRVVKSYPHDTKAYTQGLLFRDGRLFEGTGLRGASSVREVDLETGKVLRIHRLEDRYFGEGLALWQDRLVQLTWQSGVGFVYDRDTFVPKGDFSYSGEGWGLTHDGKRLIMSDGTSTLRFLDPETFAVVGSIRVQDGRRPVPRLNELEYLRGEIWANVWQTDRIARIDPETGRVLGWIDLAGLLDRRNPAAAGAEVLNGIAYDADRGRIFVTGKRWPLLFEIEIRPRP
ncbi:glutaminyl-peptide cyclotransferase [Candidatus Sumerlaeota bacterium]|nr:glutaminyl-peptide cyclotransferase [Candidatus Sumerlaeota bacterium]